MAGESERHDPIEYPEQRAVEHESPFDQMDGGISLELFWARLDPLDA